MAFIPWHLYKEILTSVPIACVDVAIIHEGRVLLVRRRDAPAQGHLWLPGGRVLKGEMLKDAALRKTQEEVGLTCLAGPLIHTAETIFDDGPGGISVHSINACFLMFPLAGSISVSIDEHHSEFVWVNRADASLHEYVKRCLIAAGLAF